VTGALAGVAGSRVIRDLGAPVPLGILTGILIGLACGAVNGLLTAKGRIPAFIVTLGMMLAARGGALLLSGGSRISGLPQSFRFLGGTQLWYVPFAVTLVIVAVFAVFLRSTRRGREIYAVGGNLSGARLSGIPVDRVRISAFALCGMLTGAGGMLLASRKGVGDPTMAEGWELDAIAVNFSVSLSVAYALLRGDLRKEDRAMALLLNDDSITAKHDLTL